LAFVDWYLCGFEEGKLLFGTDGLRRRVRVRAITRLQAHALRRSRQPDSGRGDHRHGRLETCPRIDEVRDELEREPP
jgi:hypothetical protein